MRQCRASESGEERTGADKLLFYLHIWLKGFDTPTLSESQQQVGGKVGGPVTKDIEAVEVMTYIRNCLFLWNCELPWNGGPDIVLINILRWKYDVVIASLVFAHGRLILNECVGEHIFNLTPVVFFVCTSTPTYAAEKCYFLFLLLLLKIYHSLPTTGRRFIRSGSDNSVVQQRSVAVWIFPSVVKRLFIFTHNWFAFRHSPWRLDRWHHFLFINADVETRKSLKLA